METHFNKGDKFTALISGIEEGQIKILLPNGVYGKVYYDTKNYSISKDGFCLINNSNKEMLIVGDSLDVHLRKINVDAGEVILSREKFKEYKNEEEKGKTKTKKR